MQCGLRIMSTCKRATFTTRCGTDISPSLTSEGPFFKCPQDIEDESELDFHLLLPQPAAPLFLESQRVQKSMCPLSGDSCAVSHPGPWPLGKCGNAQACAARRPTGERQGA